MSDPKFLKCFQVEIPEGTPVLGVLHAYGERARLTRNSAELRVKLAEMVGDDEEKKVAEDAAFMAEIVRATLADLLPHAEAEAARHAEAIAVLKKPPIN